MNNLAQRFREHTEASGMMPALQEGVLLAVSGGLDSMVLLHLLQGMGSPVSVAHCNFQLRGNESNEEALFVQEYCQNAGIPSHIKRFNTLSHAESEGISIQMAARNLRYQWFKNILEETGHSTLLTAHHADDHTETVLINLLRSTGAKGLAGIPADQPLTDTPFRILRPLLAFSRDELLQYAQAHGIQWREDSSNAKDDYLRNYLRHQVIPPLKKAQPDLHQALLRSADHLRVQWTNHQYLLARHLHFEQKEPHLFTIDIAALKSLPEPAAALFDLLQRYGFNGGQMAQLTNQLDHTGAIFHGAGDTRLLVDRKYLILTLQQRQEIAPVLINEEDLMVKIPGRARLFFTVTDSNPPYPDGQTSIMVPAALLQYPLTIRPWQAGDSFQPFGMQGQHQKLQDFLTNLKLSRLEKEQILVLENGDRKIVWVVGKRPDERFRITSTGEKSVKITLIC